MSAHRKFRANTLQFSKVANQVRSYYEKETETDILMKLIDTLRQDVENVKSNQKLIGENIQKVITFMKNIDLHQVDSSEKDEEEYSDLEIDEDLENYNDDYGGEAATKASEKSK
jgi:hypothetical protein